jgi:uncharacterized protein YndB with AHSA1/START domain
MDNAPFVAIRLAQRFDAPAERVFDAWIDPAIAGQWLFATASRPVARVEIDARAGGEFHFESRYHGEDLVQAGRYLELDRPRRIAFTLPARSRPSDLTRVRVEIESEESGCRLTLVHESVLRDEATLVEGRWAGMLYGLATIVE